MYVFHPVEDTYEYKWKGQPRTGTNFIVLLVSAHDPRQYIQAQFKKTAQNTQKYQQLVHSCTNGALFAMSAVGFVEDAKAAYISCPLKRVVDLAKTKMDTCIAPPDGAVQPAPIASIAGSSNIGTNQFFDVTALILEVDSIRNFPNNRSAFVVKIQDGSIRLKPCS